MNVTWLNLVLGVPLTHLYHLSAFLQVWSYHSLLCLYMGQDTQEQEPGTVSACQEHAESLKSSHLYNQIVMMSVEQITCVTL